MVNLNLKVKLYVTLRYVTFLYFTLRYITLLYFIFLEKYLT